MAGRKSVCGGEGGQKTLFDPPTFFLGVNLPDPRLPVPLPAKIKRRLYYINVLLLLRSLRAIWLKFAGKLGHNNYQKQW